MNRLRRHLLLAAGMGPIAGAAATAFDYPAARPRRLVFPRDAGAHLDYRIEWWYLTGQLDPPPATRQGARNSALGVQVTFFRMRPPIDIDNPSRFAARQIVLAHAALADPRQGALLHEERMARAGFGVATVSEADTRIDVDHWCLARDPVSGVYQASVRAAQFALELSATPTQPILLQGEQGYSLKGAGDTRDVPASLYYSEPQLALEARVSADGEAQTRSGRGWLDHEWSSTLLPAQAAGWDWAAFNLDDATALTIFRIRRRPDDGRGDPTLFAYASTRAPGRPVQQYPPSQLNFEALQYWTSPRTRASYPVAMRITVGSRQFDIQPLMQDQEFDARAGSGVVYWEGASVLLEGGHTVGRGYLELTGYAGPVPGAS